MEDHGEEILDGSSIKDVASLRSKFEALQNTSLKPAVPAPPRPLSPKPKSFTNENATRSHLLSETIVQPRSHVYGPNGHENLASASSGHQQLRPLPTVSPAVTIEPPNSPPKSTGPSLAIPSGSPLLTAERAAAPSPSAPSSPRHFRVASRPQTPLSEPRRSPSLTATQPPEPPPPRRSGELRRDGPGKNSMGPPPPVNRAEKPKILSRQSSRNNGSTSPSVYLPQSADERTSPFESSSIKHAGPQNDHLPSTSRPRPVTMDFQSRAHVGDMGFAAPPVHHSVMNKRRAPEANTPSRIATSPDNLGDVLELRPALPARNAAAGSTPSRVSMDTQRPGPSLPPSPDYRKFSRTEVPTTTSIENGTFPAPPKRNFSTPVSQKQTPPRTHGRSMTVDNTSDRAPAEFRITEKFENGPKDRFEPGGSFQAQTASHGEYIVSSIQYPDPSRSNRRPPYPKQGVHEIPTRFDSRIFAVSGQYVCSSGYLTRVWSLQDGEQVMSLSHGETIKVTSLAFKPAANVEDEGTRLWLGNNVGELIEVDIPSQNVIAAKQNAHTRREIIKIYRHLNELWTLDDAGTLHVWAPGSSGAPSFNSIPQSYRLPKGHTFSMVVGDELWHATGKDIRIFVPTCDGSAQFQILQRPLSLSTAGEVTAGTSTCSKSGKVYFGHNDGKVSIYSQADYACLGIVNVSMYKINCLTSVGDYLWTGYNTGMIYVYDTRQIPWVVKKDWHAHDNPVINILVDRSSFWKLERSQIISLGADNTLRPWDGLLQDDWLETELQSNDSSFCEFEDMKALVMTWNAGASTPHSLRYTADDSTFLRDLLQSSESPDIIVFGFQELIDLENKKTTAKSFFKSKKKDTAEHEHMGHQYRDWRDYLIRCLDDHLPGDGLYHMLHSASLVGLFTCVFVKAKLRERIRGISGVEVKRGMGGLHGNKGALVLRFLLDDTSMCFINCHPAAGQTQTKDRNYDVAEILDRTLLPAERDAGARLDSFVGGGDGSMILDHEICILNGDLNYRIDTMGRDAVVNSVKAGNLAKLLERDQLLVSRRKNPAFRLRAFQELPIAFAPTYKYDVGSDNYDSSEKKRAPAWCDRILYRCRDEERLRQLDYRRHEVRVSDHRPVSGLFHMTVKRISPKRRAMVWEDCRRRFSEIKQSLGTEAKLDYLSNVCGLDVQSSRRLLQQHDEARR